MVLGITHYFLFCDYRPNY